MKLILTFIVLALGLVLPNVYATTTTLEVNGNSHEITYEATGLEVQGLEVDTSTASVLILVSVTDPEGSLQITFDRNFFDSKTDDGEDDDFFIILDGGTEAQFSEEKTESARTLTITIPSGTETLDIIGTVFGSGSTDTVEPEEPTIEEPTPTEEPETPEQTEEPTMQCGPGTILQDGQCVLETIAETPSESETPEQTEEPTMQCGPGTILQDGQCVLDQTCGPGTILQDGQCVLDTSEPTPTPAAPRGQMTQFAIGIIAAFIIAFIIMIILWAIGKAGRKNN